MIDQSVIYGPCPCGSGKKFKFCCYKKFRSQLSDDMSPTDIVQLVRLETSGISAEERSFAPEAVKLHDEGYRFMKNLEFAEAREAFRRSRETDPRHSASWNNEASCAWELGDYEGAYEIQREGNANMTVLDSFGLARLAVYAYATGRAEESVRSLESALAMPPVSVFGALEVCFALALYHRHRDIIDYVAKSGMADTDRLAFYTGIAHANLEEMGLAELDLKKTGDSQHGLIPERYLELIRDGVQPWTTEEEDAWPYFDRVSFRPACFFSEDVVKGVDPFVRCPKPLIEDCMAFLLADASLEAHDALTLARKLTSERARHMAESLERMVKAQDECDAEESARRNADVDAQGRPRYSFDLAALLVDYSDSDLSELEKQELSLSGELVDSEISTTDDDYVRMENRMREIASAHPKSIHANLCYFIMVEKHDSELAQGLLDSFCRQHPNDLCCTGVQLMLCAKVGKYDKAAEVIDHFSVPRGGIELENCREWGVALLSLSLDDEFRQTHPAAYARAKEFLAKFTVKE